MPDASKTNFFQFLFGKDTSKIEFIEQEYKDISNLTIEGVFNNRTELIERFSSDMDFYCFVKEGLVYDSNRNIVGIYEDCLNLEYYIVAETVLCYLENRTFKNPPTIVRYY